MKRFFILFLVLFLVFSLLFCFDFFRGPQLSQEDKQFKNSKTLGLKEENDSLFLVEGLKNSYYFDYFKADSTSIFLFSNFEEGLRGDDFTHRFSCNYLVNGGFYDESFKPIGLFVSEYKEVSSWQKNRLFNGIFSINTFGTPRITREVPSDPLRLALQSGPLVFENGQKLTLKSSESYSRRVLVAVTGENETLFMIFYGISNVIEGPVLEELPFLVEKVNENYGLGIADALNLDGGAASLFYSEKTNLSEIKKVGSFFCVK